MTTHLESKSGAEIMAEAVAAAEEVLRRWYPDCSVVVNVAWRDDAPPPVAVGDPARVDCAMGSRVPRRYRRIMRESLLASAEEAEA